MSISWDDFARVDMRVGVIVDASEFPEAVRPAIKLWVDFGRSRDQAFERPDHAPLRAAET